MTSSPPDPLPAPGDWLADRYRILHPIGAGGFGRLFLAEQAALGRRVAVKVLLPAMTQDRAAVERFRLEARAACQVVHPHLVTYHDFGTDALGRHFLVMEHLDGRTLADVLDETPLLPLSRVLHLVKQLCDALGTAHRGGIVHRDLKPSNVMLVARGSDPDYVKVIDFGILKRTAPDGATAITRTDEIVGTPEYLAPEIICGERCDGRADQYAVGVMIYEMILGKRPFARADQVGVLEAQLRDAPPSLSRHTQGRLLPAGMERVLRRTLEKQPKDRFPTMGAFGTALAEVSAGYVTTEHATRTRSTVDLDACDDREGTTAVDFQVGSAAVATGAVAPAPRAGPPEGPPEGSIGARWRWLVLAAVIAVVLGTLLAVATQGGSESGASAEPPRNEALGSSVVTSTAPASPPMDVYRPGAAPAPDLGPPPSGPDVAAPPPVDASGYRAADLVSGAAARADAGGPDTRPPADTNDAPDADDTVDAGDTVDGAAVVAPRERRRPRKRVAAPRPPPPVPRPSGVGTLQVNAEPFAHISVGGRSLGNTPVLGVKLPAGRHVVVARHPSLGRRSQTVRLRSGEVTRVTFRFR